MSICLSLMLRRHPPQHLLVVTHPQVIPGMTTTADPPHRGLDITQVMLNPTGTNMLSRQITFSLGT